MTTQSSTKLCRVLNGTAHGRLLHSAAAHSISISMYWLCRSERRSVSQPHIAKVQPPPILFFTYVSSAPEESLTQHLCRLPCTYVLYKTFTCIRWQYTYVRILYTTYVCSRLQISEPPHSWLGQLCLHCLTWDQYCNILSRSTHEKKTKRERERGRDPMYVRNRCTHFAQQRYSQYLLDRVPKYYACRGSEQARQFSLTTELQ
jgi:hypothetical protein